VVVSLYHSAWRAVPRTNDHYYRQTLLTCFNKEPLTISFFGPNNCNILPCCIRRLSSFKISLSMPFLSILRTIFTWWSSLSRSSVRREELSECHGDYYYSAIYLCASSPRLTPLCQISLRPLNASCTQKL